MKRLHKLLVLVLSVSMLLGVIVVSSFAANETVAQIGNEKYGTLAEAMDAANASVAGEDGVIPGVTITLVSDTALDAMLSVSLENLAVTIDLAGYTLDVSAVGKGADTYALCAGANGSSLTVKGGSILNTSDKCGIFYIPGGIDAEINVANASVNSKGAELKEIINARSGKVTVEKSELVTYGVGASVVRQANDAEVIITDSVLFSIDGYSGAAAVIKTEATATGRLFIEQIAEDNDGGNTEPPAADDNAQPPATDGDNTEPPVATGEGDTADGDTNDGDIADGNTNDGNTNDGNTNDGNTNDGNTNDGNTNEPEIIIVERPHVLIENCDVYAAANVVLGSLSVSDAPTEAVNTWIVLDGCRIDQFNSPIYNNEGKYLEFNNNRVFLGSYCDLDFKGCEVEYARVAFETNETVNINVEDSVFSMTHLGQSVYYDAVNGTTAECDSYFVMGNGDVFVSRTALFMQYTSTFDTNGKETGRIWCPIADEAAILYAQSLDSLEVAGFELRDGCAINAEYVAPTLKDMKITELGVSVKDDLADYGSYIGFIKYETDVWSGNWYGDKSFEAKLNGVKYKTFAEAYAKAEAGDIIMLLSDVEGIFPVEKNISVVNFMGYEFTHTSTSYKASSMRGYTSFDLANSFELVKLVVVTLDGNIEVTVAAGNYATFPKNVRTDSYFVGSRYVTFKGWGMAPNDASLGDVIPYVDGSSSTVKIYAVYDEQYNAKAEYAVVDSDGNLVEWGESLSALTKENAILKYSGEKVETTKTVKLLRDVELEESIKITLQGIVCLDLNGHRVTTKNVALFDTFRDILIGHYDSTGKLIRLYGASLKVYEVDSEGNLVVVGKVEDYCTDGKCAGGEFFISDKWFEGGSTIGKYKGSSEVATTVNVFSSEPGASINTGTAAVFNVDTLGRTYAYQGTEKKADVGTASINSYIGNERLPENMKAEVGDNQIRINCSSITAKMTRTAHKTCVDDVYATTTANYAFSGSGGMFGSLEICNSIIESKASSPVVSFSKTQGLSARNTVFIGTPKVDGETVTYPTLFATIAYNSASDPDTTLTDCTFINYNVGANKHTPKKEQKLVIKGDLYYNIPGALTAATADFDLTGYTVDETALWKEAIELDGETVYTVYKLHKGNTAPEKVTVTWNYGETQTVETYFKGSKVVYDGALLANEAVDGKIYENVMAYDFTLSDTSADLDNIQSDLTVTVGKKVVGIKEKLDGFAYNVTLDTDITLSLYVPVNASITKISLMSENGEDLIMLDGEGKVQTVTLGETEYYKITSQAISPDQIHRDIVYAITVSDGVNSDVRYVSVSILDYIKDVLEDADASAELKALVNALLAYANEAYKYFDGAYNAEVSTLLGEYTVAAPTEATAKNVEAIAELVLTASLRVTSRAAIIFEVAEGVESLTIGGNTYNVKDGVVVYDIDATLANDTIEITVGDASGAYDLLAYIEALGAEAPAYSLACALYAFAGAADAFVAI